MPEYLGKGLGRFLMNEAILAAKLLNADRIWLHTCEFDSPKALDFYQKNGFEIYKETVEDEYYPKKFLKQKFSV